MKEQLLKDSLETLYGLREELNNKVDDSARVQLDEAIYLLQKATRDKTQISSTFVLEKIGLILELIVTIKALTELVK